MSEWLNIPDNINDYIGFIYIIFNLTNEKYYIGQKKFWKIEKKPPLKCMKRKRLVKKATDWQNYYGSSEELQKDVKFFGKDNFKRVIVECYTRKSMMNYYETKLQFDNNVLFDTNSYNRIINCRINKNQLGKNGDNR